MILKVLLVILVIAIVYFMFIKKKPISNSSTKKRESSKSDEMVQCSKCDVYVDIDEAILSNGKYYCSQECLKA